MNKYKLEDVYNEVDKVLEVEVRPHSSHGIEIAVKEHSDSNIDGINCPIYIENKRGKLFICLHADINKEDPTHIIDMSGALYSALEE